ncbi:hypothetical protein ACVXG7_02760 [Enterobacter hormaechei]
MIENAVDSSGKLAELADAIKENADGLAAAVGSTSRPLKQSSETRWLLPMLSCARQPNRALTLRLSNSSGR